MALWPPPPGTALGQFSLYNFSNMTTRCDPAQLQHAFVFFLKMWKKATTPIQPKSWMRHSNNKKQAGAELGQAQPKLDFGLIEISLNRVETSLSKIQNLKIWNLKFGIWKFRIWTFGIWKFGIWIFGIWIFEIWKFQIWKFGIWKFGIWKFGIWKFGIWIFGIWKLVSCKSEFENWEFEN